MDSLSDQFALSGLNPNTKMELQQQRSDWMTCFIRSTIIRFFRWTMTPIGATVIMLTILSMIGIGSTIFYLLPYKPTAFFAHHFTEADLSELRDFKFKRYSRSSVLANGNGQTLSFHFKHPQNIRNFLFGIDLRSERTLEIRSIGLYDSSEKLLKEFDFNLSQKEQWQLIHVTYAGGFEVNEGGLIQLKTLQKTPSQLLEMVNHFDLSRSDAEIPDVLPPESLILSDDLLTELHSLLGRTFDSKESLNQALKPFKSHPDWLQRKILRNAFKRAVYRTKNQAPFQIWASPDFGMVDGVSSVKIKLKIDSPKLFSTP